MRSRLCRFCVQIASFSSSGTAIDFVWRAGPLAADAAQELSALLHAERSFKSVSMQQSVDRQVASIVARVNATIIGHTVKPCVLTRSNRALSDQLQTNYLASTTLQYQQQPHQDQRHHQLAIGNNDNNDRQGGEIDKAASSSCADSSTPCTRLPTSLRKRKATAVDE